MTRRILVTGGGGFLGSRLIGRLLPTLMPGEQIFSASREAGTAHAGTTEITVDLTDRDECERIVALSRPTHVVHLAAISSVAQSMGAEDLVWRTNFFTTWHLARALRSAGSGAAFIFASSAEVYGAAFKLHSVAREDGPTMPVNAYARSKLACELILQDALAPSTPCISLRLFNSIGPGQDQRFVAASLAAQTAAIERGDAPPLLRVGNVEAARDFLDVEDTVDAVAGVLEIAAGLNGFQVYNVASGTARRISDIISELRARAVRSFDVEVDPARLRPVEIMHAVGDAGRLHALTGWTARRSWSETIGATLDYWRTARGDEDGGDGDKSSLKTPLTKNPRPPRL